MVKINIIANDIGWGGAETKLLVGGVLVEYISAHYIAGSAQEDVNLTAIIPDGSSYQAFGNSLRTWVELR